MYFNNQYFVIVLNYIYLEILSILHIPKIDLYLFYITLRRLDLC